MDYKPGDFLIGVSELVSVVLPGAVATYALGPALQRLGATFGLPVPGEGAAWVAFALVAYLLGHLVFLVGSFFDPPYDWVRKRVLPLEGDTAFKAARAIKARVLGAESPAMNTYKFATAVLALQHEAAYAEVRQLEADSKFFRSLSILGIVMLLAGIRSLDAASAVVIALGLVACAWRYAERRWKATQRAFQYVVVIHGIGIAEMALAQQAPPPTGGAGAHARR